MQMPTLFSPFFKKTIKWENGHSHINCTGGVYVLSKRQTGAKRPVIILRDKNRAETDGIVFIFFESGNGYRNSGNKYENRY
jgi:hypothetical protein